MTLIKNHTKLFKVLFVLILGMCLAVAPDAFASKDEKKDAASEKSGSVRTGMASWYGGSFHGKKTATGDQFDLNKFTCASNQYPLGTWLKVTNLKSGKTVLVRVNDRMHPRMRRIVDLSKGAAIEIGMIKAGVAKVKVEDLGKSLPGTLP
ncbi:MAG: septal ring lytic transglycosylase RlpA family protein [Chitinophagaceae bacterium]|jgi:rare lipoprotein A|nr:septal ring lytic transglycosylase RlpA family protein [Chitinophagaceae bacterium]